MQCNKLEIKKARNGETCGLVARKRNKQNGNAHAYGRGAHEVFSGLIVTTARMTACAADKKKIKKTGAWCLQLGKESGGRGGLKNARRAGQGRTKNLVFGTCADISITA